MAAQNNMLVDPVFGTLRQSSSGLFWGGKIVSRKFGTVRIHVQSDGAISDAQRNAFRLFGANEDQIFSEAQEFLFGTYNRYITSIQSSPFRSLDDGERLTKSSQIWTKLERPFDGGTTLHILYSREQSIFLTLGWSCNWDVEEGAIVHIENGNVVSRERSLELR